MVLPALSALHQTHACSKSNDSTTKPMAFALSHTLAPTSRTVSPKTSGILLLSLPSKANSRHFSSQNILVKPHCPSLLSVCAVHCPSLLSVCTVCVCVRACIFCIVMLEPLSINIWGGGGGGGGGGITFSILMYIMYVCLFSALSRRVGTLQISIIIIKTK